jgi:hypothetical protein
VDKSSFGVRRRVEQKEYYSSAENTQLYHNGSNGITSGSALLQINPLNGLTQGTTAFTRIGDNVFVKDVVIRLWLSNKLDRPNVMYRILGLYSPSPSSIAAPAISSVLSNGGANYMLAFSSTEGFTVVYDKVINPNTYSTTAIAGTNKERSFYHEVRFPFNADVTYGGTQTLTSTLYFAVVSYDTYGSLAADNIASFSYSTRTIFTDQ